MKNFRVPTHDIKVGISELLFINSRTFQRLNDIKQLGLAYFVYPFALHTRASHCMDSLHMAHKFIDHLKENIDNSTLLEDKDQKAISERLKEDKHTIRASAILHDIMHIPYAHTLEDENGILRRGDRSRRINIMLDRLEQEIDEFRASETPSDLTHYRTFSFPDQEQFGKRLIEAKNLLKDVKKVLWTIALHSRVEELIEAKKTEGMSEDIIFREVKVMVERETEDEIRVSSSSTEKVEILEAERYYISDIVGNTISVDLLSYVLRDAELTGIETKPGGWYRLFDYIEIMKDDVGRNRLVIKLTKKGEWRQDVFSTIIRILNARYALNEQVYLHHAKLSASAMLGKLAHLCGLSESESLYDVGDEGFFSVLEQQIKDIKEGIFSSRTRRDAEGAQRLLSSLRRRRLHKRFHVVTNRRPEGIDLSLKYSRPENRWKLEDYIENRYSLPRGSLIIFCPTKKVTSKEAATLVSYEKRRPEGGLETLVSPLNSVDCLEFLREEKHPSLAERVKNVEEQYEGLWKLYVFVDPSIIPIYGKEVKNILTQKLGPSTNFDLSYLELMEEYRLSVEISHKVTEMKPPGIDRMTVFQKMPVAIEEASGRQMKLSVDSIRSILDLVIRSAIDRSEVT